MIAMFSRGGWAALLALQLRAGAHAFAAPAPATRAMQLRGGFGAPGAICASRTQGAPFSALSLQAGATALEFSAPSAPSPATILVGKKAVLETVCGNAEVAERVFGCPVDAAMTKAMLVSIDGPSGSATSFVTSQGKTQRLSLAVLPDKTSRHNHPMSVHTLSALVKTCTPSKGDAHIVVAGVSAASPAAPLAAAVARAFPLYTAKTNAGRPPTEGCRTVSVSFVDDSGALLEDTHALRAAEAVAQGVRLACRLVDTPPEQLSPSEFVDECKKVASELDGVQVSEIVGEQLREQGYGGLHAVGRAAPCPPRLVSMTYEPSSATETVALVGKGITYDTGGLSLKSKDGMSGMKHDMGGAAGMLGAFFSAVKLQTPVRLHLVLCLAENSIGPTAFRNDDILTMFSGKTVEVNNCDAEGRLVLADGVAHATKFVDNLDLVIDMATLTGAQLITTGKKHAGILANRDDLEQRAMAAGLRSGDLVFPMVYAPELFKTEFKSEVADMKNSVKDRSNAQSSCAGHFIEDHLSQEYKGGWLHIDMAGPASHDQRGTGFGVAFLCALLQSPGF